MQASAMPLQQSAPMHPPESSTCVSSCKVPLCIPSQEASLHPALFELHPCIPLQGAQAPARCTHVPRRSFIPAFPREVHPSACAAVLLALGRTCCRGSSWGTSSGRCTVTGSFRQAKA